MRCLSLLSGPAINAIRDVTVPKGTLGYLSTRTSRHPVDHMSSISASSPAIAG
jgi:hypothetical protein